VANDITGNPLIIDTAGAGDVLAASQPIKVQGFAWDNAAAVTADACVVTDTAGRNLWSHTITTSLSVGQGAVSLPQPMLVKGIKVPTLTRGKLYIYLAF
jgi:hypothetical protein